MDPQSNQGHRKQHRSSSSRSHAATNLPAPVAIQAIPPITQATVSFQIYQQALQQQQQYLAQSQFLQGELTARNTMLLRHQESIQELEGELAQQALKHAEDITYYQHKHTEMSIELQRLIDHIRQQEGVIADSYQELEGAYHKHDEMQEVIDEREKSIAEMQQEILELRELLNDPQQSQGFFAPNRRRSFNFDVASLPNYNDEQSNAEEESSDSKEEEVEEETQATEEQGQARAESREFYSQFANMQLGQIAEDDEVVSDEKPESEESLSKIEEGSGAENSLRRRSP